MLLLNHVFKLNGLFTIELLAIILGIFLLAYVTKNKLNKWYRYAAIGLTAILGAIVICTAVNVFYYCCSYNRCTINKKSCYHGCYYKGKDCVHYKKSCKYKESKQSEALQEVPDNN